MFKFRFLLRITKNQINIRIWISLMMKMAFILYNNHLFISNVPRITMNLTPWWILIIQLKPYAMKISNPNSANNVSGYIIIDPLSYVDMSTYESCYQILILPIKTFSLLPCLCSHSIGLNRIWKNFNFKNQQFKKKSSQIFFILCLFLI